jgi:hypothetical protein
MCTLSVDSRVKAWNTVASSIAQGVSELTIQLGTNTTAPGVEHGVAQTDVGPAVPANEGGGVEGASRILGIGNIVVVGEAEAVCANPVLVVDELGARAVGGERIAGTIVSTVARGGNADNVIALGEDDDVLPVVAMATKEATHDGLVLLEVVLVHDGAVAVVAALAGVGVAVVQLRRVAAVTLWGAGGALAGVGVAAGVDGGGVVAAVAVKVEERLEAALSGIGGTRQRSEDVTLGDGAGSRQGPEDSSGRDERGTHRDYGDCGGAVEGGVKVSKKKKILFGRNTCRILIRGSHDHVHDGIVPVAPQSDVSLTLPRKLKSKISICVPDEASIIGYNPVAQCLRSCLVCLT